MKDTWCIENDFAAQRELAAIEEARVFSEIEKLRSQLAASEQRVKALEEALLPMAKMWIDTKAVFISEGEELPIGISIDAVSLPQWVDISSAQLDALCKALEATR